MDGAAFARLPALEAWANASRSKLQGAPGGRGGASGAMAFEAVSRAVMDDRDELITKCLSFVMGVVDSENSPLNISRETLLLKMTLRI